MLGDVEPDLVAQPQRPHRHAKIEHQLVELPHTATLVEEAHRLDHVGQQDAVHEETGAVFDQDGEFADRFHKLQRGIERGGRSARPVHDLDELHAVHGIEKMDAHHAAWIGQAGRDGVNRQSRGVRGQHRVRIRPGLQLPEYFLFQFQFLDGGFDHEVDPVQRHILRDRFDAVESGCGFRFGEDAALGRIAKDFLRRLEAFGEHFGGDVLQDDRIAARGAPLRDAGAHDPGAHHGQRAHFAARAVGTRCF